MNFKKKFDKKSLQPPQYASTHTYDMEEQNLFQLFQSYCPPTHYNSNLQKNVGNFYVRLLLASLHLYQRVVSVQECRALTVPLPLSESGVSTSV